MIKFFCRSCWFKITAGDGQVGKKVKCPKCGDANFVPATGMRADAEPAVRSGGEKSPAGRPGPGPRHGGSDDADSSGHDKQDLALSAALDVVPPGALGLAVLPAEPTTAAPGQGAGEPPGPKAASPEAPAAPARRPRRASASPPTARKVALPVASPVASPVAPPGTPEPAEIPQDLAEYASAARRRTAPGGAARRPGTRSVLISIPAVAIASVVVVALLVAVPMILRSSSGERWERDQRDRIAALAKDARSLSAAGRHAEAVAKYEDLFSLVGDRRIRDPSLRDLIRQSRDGLSESKKQLQAKAALEAEAQKAGRYLEGKKPTLLAAITKGDAALAAGRFQDAAASYQLAVELILRSPYHDLPELKQLSQRAEKGREDAHRKWAQSLEASLSDMWAKARVALAGAQLAEAERLCAEALRLAKANPVHSDRIKQLTSSVADLRTKVNEAKQTEDRRLAELRRKQQQEAEQERLRRQNAKLVFWEAFYKVVERAYREVATVEGGTEGLKALEASLAGAYGVLPGADGSKPMAAALKSAAEVLESTQSYHKTRMEVGANLTETLRDEDDPLVKVRKAKLKVSRAKLKRDAEAFAGDYAALLESAGTSTDIIPADLLQAGREARKSRDQCPWCRSTGFMPCPDCLVKGLPTGKDKCPVCDGKGYVACPVCNGAGSELCSKCGGSGRVYGGKVRTGRTVRDTYKDCPQCNGTGHTHKVGGAVRPGKCPRCGPYLPKGTIPCLKCRRTGLFGDCPTCKGEKKVPCTHCDAHKKLTATTQPAKPGV